MVENFDNQLHDITIGELGFKLNNPQRAISLEAITFKQEALYVLPLHPWTPRARYGREDNR
ncbi:MAG: hypothetical protein QXQ48_09245 [Nitrososphaerota archaeon]